MSRFPLVSPFPADVAISSWCRHFQLMSPLPTDFANQLWERPISPLPIITFELRELGPWNLLPYRLFAFINIQLTSYYTCLYSFSLFLTNLRWFPRVGCTTWKLCRFLVIEQHKKYFSGSIKDIWGLSNVLDSQQHLRHTTSRTFFISCTLFLLVPEA